MQLDVALLEAQSRARHVERPHPRPRGAHLGGDRKLLDRVTMTYYEAGHMMYVHKPSLVKLKKDVAAFMAPK